MFKRCIPNTARRWCLSVVILLAFFVALFAAGMAAYAGLVGISYGAAWTNLIEAIRAAANK